MVADFDLTRMLSERAGSRRIALISADTGVSLSYGDLADRARILTTALRLHGVGAGDRVAILLPPCTDFSVAFFGALGARAIALPLDVQIRRPDLRRLLELTGARFLVTNASLLRRVGTDLRTAGICVLDDPGGPAPRIVRSGKPAPDGEAAGPVSADDAVLVLSSGTTGRPKIVRLGHRAIMSNIRMHWESLGIEQGEGIRGLQLLPMNFSYGLIASFLSILHAGGTVVLMGSPRPGPVWEALESLDIDLVMGTPALFQYVIENSRATASPPVRYVTVGGDRCKRHTIDLLRRRLPAADIFLTYGLSEAGPRVSTLPPSMLVERPDAVGFPLRGVEVAIQDESGRPCAAGEVGEIVVRTPSLMNGYFGDPERTRQVVRDGRCHTGDLGTLDERGCLTCLGRKDRQFKLGGRLVNPVVIEECLTSHPLVREAAVEKVESDRDEWLRAKVKSEPAREQDLLPELRRFCRQRMPAHLVPSEIRLEGRGGYYYKGRHWNFAEGTVEAI